MPDFREQYKEKPFGFRGANESRLIRVEKCKETRKSQRSKAYNENRNIIHSANTTPHSKATSNQGTIQKEDRITRFKKWKVEKERQRRVEQIKKKPPFKVGVVHHKIYSPATSHDESILNAPNKSKIHINMEPVPKPGRKISKVTEKRLKAKAMMEKVKPTQKMSNVKVKIQKAPQAGPSLAPANCKFTAPAGLIEMPLFGKSIITAIDKHIKNFALSPPKRRSLAKRASTTAFVVENLYTNENIGPVDFMNDESIANKEDSVETITLRLSSDGYESLNSSIETKMQKSLHTSLLFKANTSTVRLSSSDSKSNTLMEAKDTLNPGNTTVLNTTFEYQKDESINGCEISQSKGTKVFNSSIEKKDALNVSNTAGLNTTFEYKTEPLNVSGSGKVKSALNSSVNEVTPKGYSSHTPESSASVDSRKSNSSSDPALFSPYIVSSRGKSKARKEQQQRRGLGKSPGDGIPTKDTVMQQCLNMSIEDEERTAQYFYFLVDKESERLAELCRQWEEKKTESGVTEDGQYQINQAIGQTNLLLNKKFERFRGLVRDCESGKGEMLVTCKDLQGFWDMMYREVKDCNTRFQKLEKSRSENWVEEKPEVVKPVAKKKTVAKKKLVTSKPSGMRALIMAARKERMLSKMDSNSDKSDVCQSEDSSASDSKSSREAESSTARNYTRKSISSSGDDVKQTPSKRESTRMSLLQKVQLSETSKKIRSPLTIMKISKMYKTPDSKVEEVKTYSKLEQTPGKSILKKSKGTRDLDSSTKMTHKVNFDESITVNEVPVDEEVQTKFDLAAALERIESFDFDTSREQVELAVERKLNFDSDSSDEAEDILDKLEKQEEELKKNSSFYDKNVPRIPALTFQEATPMKDLNEKSIARKSLRRQNTAPAVLEHPTGSPLRSKESQSPANRSILSSGRRRQLTRQKTVDEEASADDDNESIRILRNRTISTHDPPRTPRTPRRKASTNAPGSEQKENITPSRRRRKGSLKVTTKDEQESKMGLEDAMDLISLNENDTDKPKRSTRFSVKYSESDCTGCMEQRPAYPVTPHVRRSKLPTSEKKRRSKFTGNTSSLGTPEKFPERIRRSRSTKL